MFIDEEITEIVDAEKIRVTQMMKLLHDVLCMGKRAISLTLKLNQEAEQLIRRHFFAAVGIFGEGIHDVLRWARLLRLELPIKDSEHLVAPHFDSQTGVLELQIDLVNCLI